MDLMAGAKLQLPTISACDMIETTLDFEGLFVDATCDLLGATKPLGPNNTAPAKSD